jgi:c-di-GMP-related signal transduction protein|tara:strand:- start:517 stop:810 length:294 start_codon:yes stop_codon:yes gene_type:complete
MWNIDYVNDMINVKSELIQDKESFIREVDFNRDITQAVLSRSNLLQQVTQLEEIRDEMQKCLDHEDTNEYISQFALVYTLIEKYKAERDAERDQPLS